MRKSLFQKKVRDNLIKLINSLPKRIAKDASYFVGGKKLRSNLMYRVGKLLNCSDQKLLLPASVLELIHTTTIIHDDVLDHTSIRRSKRTIHSIYKKRITIFSADYLIAKTLEEFVQNTNLNLQSLFFKKIREVCEGEIKQDFNNNLNSPLSRSECIQIASKKTGSLFSIAFAAPAVLTEISIKNRKIIEEIGNLYGIIYQLLDDYSDILFDARLDKGNGGTEFKHWTMPMVLWHEIDSLHFLEFINSKTDELNDSIREKILDKLFEIIAEITSPIKQQLVEELSEDSNQTVFKCLELVKEEINSFSPRPIDI